MTVALMKQRDHREAELDTNEGMKKACEDSIMRYKDTFKQKLASYHQWCRDNKIDPVKYPFV